MNAQEQLTIQLPPFAQFWQHQHILSPLAQFWLASIRRNLESLCSRNFLFDGTPVVTGFVRSGAHRLIGLAAITGACAQEENIHDAMRDSERCLSDVWICRLVLKESEFRTRECIDFFLGDFNDGAPIARDKLQKVVAHIHARAAALPTWR